MKPDDFSISDDEIVYRYCPSIPHSNWTVIDQETAEVQITVAALRWDPDGISCYRETILRQSGLDWSAVKREPRNGIFSLIVERIRSFGLGIAEDPNPPTDHPHPRDVAHSLIVDCDLPKRENRDAREALCVEAQIIHFGDPE